MSQSWCWQWDVIREWFREMEDYADLDVYTLLYDNTEYYEDFMSFKEEVFANFEIPYIRYYIDGKFERESNYTSKESFLRTFHK
jgi:hypothetical protein